MSAWKEYELRRLLDATNKDYLDKLNLFSNTKHQHPDDLVADYKVNFERYLLAKLPTAPSVTTYTLHKVDYYRRLELEKQLYNYFALDDIFHVYKTRVIDIAKKIEISGPVITAGATNEVADIRWVVVEDINQNSFRRDYDNMSYFSTIKKLQSNLNFPELILFLLKSKIMICRSCKKTDIIGKYKIIDPDPKLNIVQYLFTMRQKSQYPAPYISFPATDPREAGYWSTVGRFKISVYNKSSEFVNYNSIVNEAKHREYAMAKALEVNAPFGMRKDNGVNISDIKYDIAPFNTWDFSKVNLTDAFETSSIVPSNNTNIRNFLRDYKKNYMVDLPIGILIKIQNYHPTYYKPSSPDISTGEIFV